ncbi:MAG: glycosyltransferase family 2 protein [Candidatus Edwardsbacteria bacterium]
MLNLSVIIVTWQSEKYIKPCLRSAERELNSLNGEIIVVDNHSSDGSVEALRKDFPTVQIVENSQNLGFAKAVNQGLRLAKGKYIFLLNPDTIILPGALLEMINFLESHPTVGILGPQLLNSDGTIQSSCREFPSYQNLIWEILGLARLFPKHKIFGRWKMSYFSHNELREVDQPMGSALMVRKDVVEQIGVMDERFSMFFNEVDWCYRMKEMGWKIYFLPQAKIIHHLGASTCQSKIRMILFLHYNLLRFLAKYERRPLGFLPLTALATLLLFVTIIRICFNLIFDRSHNL